MSKDERIVCTHTLASVTEALPFLIEKEVIQPHFPVRLPCYDFTPLTKRTFDSVLHCWLDDRLRVPSTRMV